jgi:hypothetical protein
VLVLPVLLVRRRIHVGAWEVWAFALFAGAALSTTFLSGYPRFKAAEQIVKFIFVMPAFYLIGRYYGARACRRPLPFGYVAIAAFVAIQYALQYFDVPVLYEKVDFMQNAVHGSFKERNWFAAFFFLSAYACFLQSPRRVSDVAKFVALALVVTLLSESKTVLIACALVILLQVRGHLFAKVLTMAAGAAFYLYMFTRELTGDQLQVRLQQERGLAFVESVKLVGRDWIGHGFGFVEHYFSHSAVAVRGLGEGTSAVFARRWTCCWSPVRSGCSRGPCSSAASARAARDAAARADRRLVADQSDAPERNVVPVPRLSRVVRPRAARGPPDGARRTARRAAPIPVPFRAHPMKFS